MKELLKAVHGCRPWLDGFNRMKYKGYFERYLSLYKWSLVNIPNDPVILGSMASSFVDEIAEAIKAEHFWNRSAAFADDKTMLIVYFSPMLLASENEVSRQFAYCVCEAWNKKYPKDTYQVADFDTIMSGFTNTIMGIKM